MRFIPHRGDTKRDWLQGLRQPEVNLTNRLVLPVRISGLVAVWRPQRRQSQGLCVFVHVRERLATTSE